MWKLRWLARLNLNQLARVQEDRTRDGSDEAFGPVDQLRPANQVCGARNLLEKTVETQGLVAEEQVIDLRTAGRRGGLGMGLQVSVDLMIERIELFAREEPLDNRAGRI